MTEDEVQVFKIQDQAKEMNIPPRESTCTIAPVPSLGPNTALDDDGNVTPEELIM